MYDVEVHGFQSIEHVRLPIDGFTAVLGRSNIGKSALVRAIKSAITNAAGTAFVRHNPEKCARILAKAKACKCQASVHLRSEGFDLLWEKGDAVNRYTLNGQVYDKPGQGIPDFLVKSGLSPLRIGDSAAVLQVSDQFFPIFLLNQSGPAAAEAISDVARLDRINVASRLVEKDKRDALAERKLQEKECTSLALQLEEFEGLDAACMQVERVAAQLEEIEVVTKKVASLDRFDQTSRGLVSRIRAIWAIEAVPVPSDTDWVPCAEKLGVMTSLSSSLAKRVHSYKSVQWVEGFLKEIPNMDPVTDNLQKLSQLDAWASRLKSFGDRFEGLETVETLRVESPDSIQTKARELQEVSLQCTRLQTLEEAAARLEEEIASLEQDLTAISIQVDALGVCPTCTQPVGQAHAHA